MIYDEPKLNQSNQKKIEESQICKIILEKILSQYPSTDIVKVLLSSYYMPIDTTKKTITKNELIELLKMISEKVGKLNIIKYLLDLEFCQKNSEKFSEISTENTISKNNKKINSDLINSENFDSHSNLETDKFFKLEQNSFSNCFGNKEENVFYNSDDDKNIEIQIRREEIINTDKVDKMSNGGSKSLNTLNNINNNKIVYLSDSDSEDIIQIYSKEIKTKKGKSKKKFLRKKTRNNKFKKSKQKEKKRKIFSVIKPKKIKLGNHYSIGKGYFYKYFYKSYKGNFAKFICADKICKSIGKYNTKEKMFQLINIHSLLPEEHSYNKNKKNKDLKIIKFMESENIEEMQFKK